jgi:GT2 family glycosyltransferase
VAATGPVGVVIATRNRAERLVDSVAHLLELSGEPPVVVVDNGSTDGTADLVREAHPGVRVIRLLRNHGAAARTIGARLLTTPYIAFSDDDSWWAAGALEQASALLAAHPRLALIASRTLVGPAEKLDPVSAEMAASPLPPDPSTPGAPVLGFVACGAAVRRSAFLEAGGFHPKLVLGGEETLLALDLAAAGWKLAYVDSIVSHHHPDAAPRHGRTVMQMRNALWTSWLRLPAAVAVRETAALAARAPRDPPARTAMAGALRGLPWVARERRPLPRGVAEAYGMLGLAVGSTKPGTSAPGFGAVDAR